MICSFCICYCLAPRRHALSIQLVGKNNAILINDQFSETCEFSSPQFV